MALPYCSDCGDARVNHVLNKFSLTLEHFTNPITAPAEGIGEKTLHKLKFLHLEKLVLPIFNFFARIGIGTIGSAFRDGDSIRTKALFDGAAARGITLHHFRFFDQPHDGIFVAQKDGRTIVFDVMPRPSWWKSGSLSWMDDKGILKKKLSAAGVPVARGGVAYTRRGALGAAAKGTYPFIAKPTLGTRGRHTTIGLKDETDLLRGFDIAKQIAPFVVIEEELQGTIHRVTVIGGKVVGVARRDPPQVVGDGVHTIDELIDIENKNPLRDELRFYPLQRSDRMERELERQGYTKDSIPEKGVHVIINDKISRIHGTVTYDVTDETHPDIIELFEGPFMQAINDSLVGVDFMIGDISKSWKEQPRCGVVECNAMPYIDIHHYLYGGTERNVAAQLWDLVFADGPAQ